MIKRREVNGRRAAERRKGPRNRGGIEGERERRPDGESRSEEVFPEGEPRRGETSMEPPLYPPEAVAVAAFAASCAFVWPCTNRYASVQPHAHAHRARDIPHARTNAARHRNRKAYSKLESSTRPRYHPFRHSHPHARSPGVLPLLLLCGSASSAINETPSVQRRVSYIPTSFHPPRCSPNILAALRNPLGFLIFPL